MVDLKTLNLHGVSPTTLILSESIQNMHHFGVSPITTVFFVKETRVIEIHPDLRLSQLQSNSKLYYSKSLWGVTNNVEIITKYMEKASLRSKFCHDSII